jgi:hypothetical protein
VIELDVGGYDKARLTLVAGVKKGWSGFVWILKILVPISFLTELLEYSGWLHALDNVLEPLMKFIHLPPEAALPLLTGLLTGVYSAIASMAVLPLTVDQMTLIAIFLMIAHNLIQEGIIQAKSGVSAFKAIGFRLTAAVVTVMIVAHFLPSDTTRLITRPSILSTAPGISEMLKSWSSTTFWLCLKILAIITAVMVVIEALKSYNLIDRMLKVLGPILKLMGLTRGTGLLWLTGAMFGLVFGSAIIVAESKTGQFSREEIEKLHLSIGMNHSMIEDPALFLSLGVNPFWVIIPRLLAAIVVVYLVALWYKAKIFFKHFRAAANID